MGRSILDLLFPRFCLGCGYLGTYVCAHCEMGMKKINTPICFYCKKPSLLGLTHPRCRQQKGIDGFLSHYLYNGLFKKILQESKYKGAYSVLQSLLEFPKPNLSHILNKWNDIYSPYVISVPLHPKRIRERGFNQSDIIAKKYFNSNMLAQTHFLQRTINTDHLANIGNKNKRKQHIRDAFVCDKKYIPKHIILVDDVITSGATIIECSKVLKERGAQTVLAFSLAEG